MDNSLTGPDEVEQMKLLHKRSGRTKILRLYPATDISRIHPSQQSLGDTESAQSRHAQSHTLAVPDSWGTACIAVYSEQEDKDGSGQQEGVLQERAQQGYHRYWIGQGQGRSDGNLDTG